MIDILLVEDDPADVLMTREAFEHHRITSPLHVASDGVEAMEFLHRRGRFGEAPRPGLVLLDLNLPRKDGREVLGEIKRNPELRAIPVVVLTTSAATDDVVRCYELHANAYVPKPVDFGDFVEVVRRIDAFWAGVVKLPPPPGP